MPCVRVTRSSRSSMRLAAPLRRRTEQVWSASSGRGHNRSAGAPWHANCSATGHASRPCPRLWTSSSRRACERASDADADWEAVGHSGRRHLDSTETPFELAAAEVTASIEIFPASGQFIMLKQIGYLPESVHAG